MSFPGTVRAAPALLLALLAALPSAAGNGARPAAVAPATLKLATWNMEWFLTPATFNALKQGCTRDEGSHRWNPRSIPCDVAATLERSATDIAGMARVAERLDADVVAVEEVDGAAAAAQVFRGYDFCFTGGREVQNTGFAIRRGLPHRCGPDLVELSLGDQLRRGATLVLYPGSRRELYLLAVHLKSGCARASLASRARACERLARQAPSLREWIDTQRRAGHRYAVLGDFNRELQSERGAGLWEQLGGGAPDAPLVNTADGERFRNCYAGQTHTGYIDYILLGTTLAPSLQRGSFERQTYSPADAWRLKLSDHCPVALRLRLD
ncbi:MAG: endonuclease/exonuclease/phosphatase family protein, partial [Proteobacteria bacterium]|nr:endonuclease/exonuclease/phosphatase family protein [Pseudomonadota bacterium]